VKNGTPPDPALVSLAGTRSRHNTYMSAALLWGMIDSHTTALAGGNYGITAATSFLAYLVVILVSWHVIWHLYRRTAKVKGF
jgi:uncharacterized membrane protein